MVLVQSLLKWTIIRSGLWMLLNLFCSVAWKVRIVPSFISSSNYHRIVELFDSACYLYISFLFWKKNVKARTSNSLPLCSRQLSCPTHRLLLVYVCIKNLVVFQLLSYNTWCCLMFLVTNEKSQREYEDNR
jgi:hypothetical protein